MNKKILILGGLGTVLIIILITLVLVGRPTTIPTETTLITTPILNPTITVSPQEIEAESAPPVEAFEETLENYRTQKPDLFLAHFVPYDKPRVEEKFLAERDFKTEPTNHYFFIVTLRGDNKIESLQDFHRWLTSLGLSETQINQLDIVYK